MTPAEAIKRRAVRTMTAHDAQPRWIRDLVNKFGEGVLDPEVLHQIYAIGPGMADSILTQAEKAQHYEYLRAFLSPVEPRDRSD